MTFKIPKTLFGKKVEGSLERMLEQKQDEPEQMVVSPVIANVRGSNYIQVPEKNIVIAKRQAYNGLQWEQAIEAVQKDGLYVPRIDQFMQHFVNLQQAAEGKRTLLDGDGKALTRDEAIENWNYVSSTNRTPFNSEVFWTWLDAKFEKDPDGSLHLETNHKTGNSFNIHKLDPHLKSDCYVDLNFNNQGLPVSRNAQGNYVQGKNIYFWQPVEGRVAGFDAGSGGAGLYCYRNPSYRNSSLGVLSCAEGAGAKI